MGKNAQKFIASDCNLFKVKVLSDAQWDFFNILELISFSPNLELTEIRLF